MSRHLYYDHECPSCGALYLPYDDVACPKCGTLEEERYDFISEAMKSMLLHKSIEKRYAPPVWAVLSFADSILLTLMCLFDKYEEDKPRDFKRFAHQCLSQMNWEERGYLLEHVKGMAMRIHEEMKRRKRTRT